MSNLGLLFVGLLALVGKSLSGRVDYTRCGGVATITDFRISDCQGEICFMFPGTEYAGEKHILPSSQADSLTLKISVTWLGSTIPIVDAVLENSDVIPGIEYTVKYTLTPDDILSGYTVPLRVEVSKTSSGLVETCVVAQVAIQ